MSDHGELGKEMLLSTEGIEFSSIEIGKSMSRVGWKLTGHNNLSICKSWNILVDSLKKIIDQWEESSQLERLIES